MSTGNTGIPENWVCINWNIPICRYGFYYNYETKNFNIYYKYDDNTPITTISDSIQVEKRTYWRYYRPDDEGEVYWLHDKTEYIPSSINITLPPLPTKTGYTYTSWKTGTVIYPGSQTVEVTVNYDTTFYAIGSVNDNTTYTATWNYNNGSENTTTSITYNTTLSIPATPTKSGYTFAGWINGTTIYTADFTYNYASNETFTAQWTINIYTLTFDPNGKGTGKIISVNYNSNILAPILKAVGYTFNGYYNDSSGSTLVVSGGATYTMPSSNNTLYANWTDNNIVKFSDLQDTYGGTYPIYMSEYQASISKASSNLTKLMIDFKGKGPAP